MKTPLDGGPPTVLIAQQAQPRTIAVDGTSVYYNVYSSTSDEWGADGIMKLTPK
jgi:hypothetical protein